METGFPSPAQGYEAKPLDLNDLMVRNRPATYLMEMSGRALEGIGIYPKDWLLVDRSRQPRPDSVVIAEYGGEFVCRIYRKALAGFMLVGRGVDPILVTDEVRIVAVVSFSIRRLP